MMDSETKVIYHGATVVDGSMPNPPQYSSYPPPGSAPYVGPPATVIQTVPSGVIVAQQVGPQPSTLVCRSCNSEIVTRIEKVSSTKTHLFALGLCIFCCWPCVCIPYCTDSCKNTTHYCPNCSAYIGVYTD